MSNDNVIERCVGQLLNGIVKVFVLLLLWQQSLLSKKVF